MIWDNENMLDLEDLKIPLKNEMEIPLMSSSCSEIESESETLELPNSDGEDFCGTFV